MKIHLVFNVSFLELTAEDSYTREIQSPQRPVVVDERRGVRGKRNCELSHTMKNIRINCKVERIFIARLDERLRYQCAHSDRRVPGIILRAPGTATRERKIGSCVTLEHSRRIV